MNKFRRWIPVLCFIFLSLTSKGMTVHAQNIADNSVQVALNLTDESNARYSFGFSSNEIKTLYDEVDDITSRGVDLTVSEEKKKRL